MTKYLLTVGSTAQPLPWDNSIIAPAGVAVMSANYANGYIPPNGFILVPFNPTIPIWKPPAPISVEMWQAKALLASLPGAEPGKTLLDDANTVVSSLSSTIQMYWEYATSVSSNNSSLIQIASSLNISKQKLLSMFISASRISLK